MRGLECAEIISTIIKYADNEYLFVALVNKQYHKIYMRMKKNNTATSSYLVRELKHFDWIGRDIRFITDKYVMRIIKTDNVEVFQIIYHYGIIESFIPYLLRLPLEYYYNDVVQWYKEQIRDNPQLYKTYIGDAMRKSHMNILYWLFDPNIKIDIYVSDEYRWLVPQGGYDHEEYMLTELRNKRV